MNEPKGRYAISTLRHHLPDEAERRAFAHDAAILTVTIALEEEMERLGVTRAELARRLDRTPGFVSQVLNGARNMTLRTVADIAYALGLQVRSIEFSPLGEMRVPTEVIDEYLDQYTGKVAASPSQPVQFKIVAESPVLSIVSA